MARNRRPSSWTDTQTQSVKMTDWVKNDIKQRAENFLWARTTHLTEMPITANDFIRMTFDSKEDYDLHKAFRAKFRDQYVYKMNWSVYLPVELATGEKFDFEMDFNGRLPIMNRPAKDGFTSVLAPDAYARFFKWFDSVKLPLIETLVGVWVVQQAMASVDTSVQLRALWPGLLDAVKVNMVSRGQSTKQITPYFNTAWMPKINEWLTEGALRYEPQGQKTLRSQFTLLDNKGNTSNVHWKFDTASSTGQLIERVKSLKLMVE